MKVKNNNARRDRNADIMLVVKSKLPGLAAKMEAGATVGPADLHEVVSFLADTLMADMEQELLHSFANDPYKMVALLIKDGGEMAQPILSGAPDRDKMAKMVEQMKGATLRTVGTSPKNLNWRVHIRVFNETFDIIPELGFNKTVLELLV